LITIIVNNTTKIEKIRDYFLNSIQNFNKKFMSERRFTKTQFKEELEKLWEKDGVTNLELVNFDTSDESMKVNDEFEVHCKIHDYTFKRKARRLLDEKSWCDKCRLEKQSRENTIPKKEFLKRMKKKHGDNSQYDYEKTLETYTGMAKPLTVYCTKHGPYQLKRAVGFLYTGCSECRAEHIGDLFRRTTEEFISEAESVWGPGRWGYDRVDYINNSTPVEIYCPIHDEFFWQVPSSHLYGYCGCNKCKPMSLGENRIKEYLDSNHILYRKNVNYDTGQLARDSNRVNIDFVIGKDIWIEYNGQQHYGYVPMFHHDKYSLFLKQYRRDTVVKEYAESNGIHLLTIPYVDLDRIPEILEEFLGSTHNNIATVLHPKLLPILYGQD